MEATDEKATYCIPTLSCTGSTFAKTFSLSALLSPPQQLTQAAQTASTILQEIIYEQLFCTGTTLHIHAQTHTQEALKFSAELVRVLQSRRAVGRNQEESLQWLFVEVWGL